MGERLEHARDALTAADVEALRAAAAEIAGQDGRGLRRRRLLTLAGRPFAVSILRPEEHGDPVLAVVQARVRTDSDPFASLTVREREVAALVARGLTNKGIAATLGISVGTVKDHVHRILVKSALGTRTAVAVRWQQR
jgi:DNA-binding NarL/FixJ family response regulator